jgi:hypothetical protein
MRNLYRILARNVCVAVVVLLLGDQWASGADLLFRSQWSPKALEQDSVKALNALDVQIVHGSSEFDGILKVFRNGKCVYSFGPKMHPESISTLFYYDDKQIATIWSTPDGHWCLYGFAYMKGRVQKVLECYSSLPAEFAFPSVPKRDVQVRQLQQRILIANTEWVKARNSNNHELKPVSADIYNWNERRLRYDVLPGVPWNRRFQF